MFRIVLLLGLLCSTATAQDQMQLPPEVREWFRNPDGSCVQCSIGMCGVWHNVPAATTLLWKTEYGPAVRGGSYPSRVEGYCDSRKIAAYNITGDSTWEWMKWSARTGRMAAIGCARSHFQTLCYYDPKTTHWFVCNNNSPQKIDEYDTSTFRQLHLASGPWVVILKGPAPPPMPTFVDWWN